VFLLSSSQLTTCQTFSFLFGLLSPFLGDSWNSEQFPVAYFRIGEWRQQSGSVRAVSIAHPLLARIPATRSASLMTYIPHRLGGQNPRKRKKKKYTTSRRSPHFKQERIAVAKQKILWTQKGEKMVVVKAVANSTYSDCELSK
jgi:hypothetical protein